MDEQLLKHLQDVTGTPPGDAVARSQRRVETWFAEEALLLHWDVVGSPVGPLVLVVSDKGLRGVGFGADPDAFLGRLDPLARAEQNDGALAFVTQALGEYFAGKRFHLDLPIDFGRMKPFQQSVLQVAYAIPAGTVWTYKQVAQAVDRPEASRAVGQALARNPIPIVLPCHRVVGSSGGLRGYGGGLEIKRYLLRLEGAL
jgi:methylated-DNA-[protein]-cysteine S-methyltransferase